MKNLNLALSIIKRRKSKIIISCLFVLNITAVLSQNKDIIEYEYYFGSIAPLMKLESQESNGKYYFYANNTSFYPLWINVTCNLTNMEANRSLPYEELVYPGRTTLFYLEQKDNEQTYSYNFKYSSQIGNPFAKYNDQIDYLIPLKPGKKTIIYQDKPNQMGISFSVNPGDTVLASRRGYVCGTPKLEDRFGGRSNYSISNNLEIMHLDASFGIYSNLDPNNVFVQRGQSVNPGDPIGIAKLDYIDLNVILFNNEHKIKSLPIKLFTEDLGAIFLNNKKEFIVIHPDKVIEQEMTKSQIKKQRKKQQKVK